MLASLAGVVFLCGAVAYAQTSAGSLGGTITDPNGASIPDAKVTATNVSTGAKQEVISTAAGLYLFSALPVSQYSVTVEKPGFKKLHRQNIEIRIAQRLDMDMRLEVGEVQQTVDVTAEAPLLETSSPERGQSLSQKFMDNLPLFSGGIRSPRAFVNYMPGVTNNSEQSVSGSGGRAQEVLIDGGSALNNESSAVFNFPSSEMFSEFKMLQSNYSAEYGRVGGGIEIYVAKSGTNWVHGAAFHNMRRDIWNANAWARNANPNPAGSFRPKERFNETGGVIGGPVYIPKVYDGRNKTFWFFVIDKDIRPATLGFPVLTVPTALMKRGNFTEAGVPVIYDPLAPTTAGDGRTPFAGNIIPTSRFSKVAQNLIPLIPDPTQGKLAGNYDFVNTTLYERTIWSLKFDHAFTPTNRVSYFYSNENELTDAVANFNGPLGDGLRSYNKPFNHRVNHDLNIRPNLLMHTNYSFSRTRAPWDNPNQKGAGSKLGFNLTGDSDATPRIMFSGAAGLTPYGRQDGKVANGGQYNTQFTIQQGFTVLKGKHEFKFGWAYRRFETFGFDLAGTNGRYVFNRAQTALPTALTSTGHEFASLLLGGADQASQIVPPVLFSTSRYHDMSGYVTDNWRIHKRLTLTLGIRYEVPIAWYIPTADGYSHIDLKTPNPAAGGLPGALVFSGTGPGRTGEKRFFPIDFSDIGPRLGFAYQMTSKTVIRGGYAIYYQGISSGGCGCRYGFAGSNDLVSDGRNAILNWDNGVPLAPGYRPPPIIDPSYVNFQTVATQSKTSDQAGRIQNWSLGIQHEVKNYLFDVSYQGNRGTRLNSTSDLNQLPVSQLLKGSLLGKRIDSPEAIAAGIKPPFANFPASQTVAQALRNYPQYLGLYALGAAYGRSWYDALQAKLERRFGSYQIMANYTWSKSLGYGHYRQVFDQIGTPGTPQDYNDPRESKSYNNMDIPHVFNILSTFDLPFGKGKKFLKSDNKISDLLASGWTVSTAHVYRAGTLIRLVTPGNPLGNGVIFAQNTKANLTGAPISTGVDRTSLDPNDPNSRWINPAAFAAAPLYTLGTAAFYQNSFRNPMFMDERLSIVKRTTLWNNDRNPVVLTYRADAFNLLNRTAFGGIVGTVGNANFGRPTGPQNGARIITMGLRLTF